MLEYFKARQLKVYPEAVNINRSYNGLFGLLNEQEKTELIEGSIFIFINRRRKMLKALYWEDTHFCIWQMRQESGVIDKNIWQKTSLEYGEFLMLINCINLGLFERKK